MLQKWEFRGMPNTSYSAILNKRDNVTKIQKTATWRRYGLESSKPFAQLFLMEAKKEEQDLSTLQILGLCIPVCTIKSLLWCQMFRIDEKSCFTVRWCSNGVISSLERFFSWYGRLVSSHPWTAIFICLAATVGGGLGLLRCNDTLWIYILIWTLVKVLWRVRRGQAGDTSSFGIPEEYRLDWW